MHDHATDCPVTDTWRQDFDLYDPAYLDDPFAVWDWMRRDCPVAHTDRHGGGHLLARHEDIVAVAGDPDTYSSRAVEVTGPVPAPGRGLSIPPVTADPPEHGPLRRLLLPLFSRSAVQALEPLAREIAVELVSVAATQPRVDAMEAFARPLPVAVMAHMLGLPREDEERFRDWTTRMLKDGAQDYEIRAKAIGEIRAYLERIVIGDQAPERKGVIRFLIERQQEHPSLTQDEVIGMCFLMLIAGIDTTWSGLGSSLWRLATCKEERDRLLADPSLIPSAVEEYLRVYGPVTIGRVVEETTELAGERIPAGDRVLLPWAAASCDPTIVQDAGRVDIARKPNRHLAFGYGIHRCLGAQLAQMELRVALEEWLRAVPNFHLDPAQQVQWTGGNVRGPESLHLVIANPEVA